MENFVKLIDHTLLKPEGTSEDIKSICKEALELNTASVCVNPVHVELVSKMLSGSDVKTCVVVGFPLGANKSEVKAFETDLAIKDGAQEVDMVLNIGALKDKNYDLVLKDIKSVVDAASNRAIVKVILETCLLTKEEIVKASELSVEAGADFVKTSTGFSKGGATVEDVELMRKTVGKNVGVKASGGVRKKEDVLAMVNAGANRIGASSTKAIANGFTISNDGY